MAADGAPSPERGCHPPPKPLRCRPIERSNGYRPASVAPALEKLPDRERRILYLRFFKGMTQTEIAQEIGISQMHISRLIAQSLERVRSEIRGPDVRGHDASEPERDRR